MPSRTPSGRAGRITGGAYRHAGGVGREWWAETLVTEYPDRPWLDRAQCRGMDPNIFYSDGRNDKNLNLAKQTCRQCPVRLECLEFALAIDDRDGVQGGVEEANRRLWQRRGMSPREMIDQQDDDDKHGRRPIPLRTQQYMEKKARAAARAAALDPGSALS